MDRKILVIDDDSLILMIHEAKLEDETNCACAYFDNAKSALSHIIEVGKSMQFLLLLDINMPVMNGWDLLDEIKNYQFKDNILTVMVTSSVNEADKQKAEQYDMVVDFLSKPLKTRHIDRLRNIAEVAPFFKEAVPNQNV
ncbi:response regulator [Pedobacter jejuensis]|uniref:Response regulator n=1 Tax=Pedobacter jejuensis TaxID=1268550 RepID=A0A3N0BQ89_9SPHI|nr:response regulator [Pedobacter jejuensis]RNL51151.1 response regulator [Pedobacter jejuensis]